MREITIRIPDGWILKAITVFLMIAFLMFVLPFWWVQFESYSTVERMRASIEARKIAGECPAKGVSLP